MAASENTTHSGLVSTDLDTVLECYVRLQERITALQEEMRVQGIQNNIIIGPNHTFTEGNSLKPDDNQVDLSLLVVDFEGKLPPVPTRPSYQEVGDLQQHAIKLIKSL